MDAGEVGSFEVGICSGSCATDGAMIIAVIISKEDKGIKRKIGQNDRKLQRLKRHSSYMEYVIVEFVPD